MATYDSSAHPPQQVVIVTEAEYGPYPRPVNCPHCQRQVTTVVKKESGLLAWLLCMGLCLVGCGFGCCLIPFCVDSCQDTIHMCPHCNKVIAAHKRC